MPSIRVIAHGLVAGFYFIQDVLDRGPGGQTASLLCFLVIANLVARRHDNALDGVRSLGPEIDFLGDGRLQNERGEPGNMRRGLAGAAQAYIALVYDALRLRFAGVFGQRADNSRAIEATARKR